MPRFRISAGPLALAALAALAAACEPDTTTPDPLPAAACRIAFNRPVELRALAIAADADGELHVLAEEAAFLELDRGPLSTIAAYEWLLVVDRPYEALARTDSSPCPEGV